ncbi:TetR/AcrR family transcriptional regulator [Conexibacter stalactiti]|uniref:TetR/AcrR family transcriptional regulator n=1 Tax=Conexibacter stalactiti TaxID=1940611 RepID=A0ABU4HVZ0_9ACTN|nr:TetR/AcrR family transcriptional regulator [Conexibacter stalactiti]MDW5596842.1 TetR/AcrR family transcriptional regulator [Conexibacter stalactiti]MEC5037484.1 TetR/AcrR family transcriptional regulator [Conexibacter stalactiti]
MSSHAIATPNPRGRMDKRQAMLDAALVVFAREGYAQATVDQIATEAGVAKPTIYAHVGDKETLFRLALTETAARANGKTLALLKSFPTDPRDLRGELTAVAQQIVPCMVDEQSTAVRRLVSAEAVRLPGLFEAVRSSGAEEIIEALAGRLARLANAGHLEVRDPVVAASQFIALIAGDLPMMAVVSPHRITEAEREQVVADGVETFLRAFARHDAAS